MRLLAGVSTVVLAFSAVAVVSAQDLVPSHEGVTWDDPDFHISCPDPLDPGLVLWHFVLSGWESDPITLTAEFAVAGTFQVPNGQTNQSTAHFEVITGEDTLVTASTDVDGNALSLQYTCTGFDAPQPSFGPSPNPGAGNTPTGGNVQTSPGENGVPTPHQVIFENVTSSGVTTVTTSSTGPALPAGFQLGSPPRFYDLQTTATISGSITVCLNFAGVTPAPTALLHFEGGAWVDITIEGNLGPETICGETTSLSPFVAVTVAPPTISSFFQPLNDPISASSPMSVFKGGSTVPVKFALRDAAGALFSDAAAGELAGACALQISLVRIGSGAPAVDETVNSNQPHAGNCFRYDAGANQFIFNLSTKGLAKPATYELKVTLFGTGSIVLRTHTLAIGLR